MRKNARTPGVFQCKKSASSPCNQYCIDLRQQWWLLHTSHRGQGRMEQNILDSSWLLASSEQTANISHPTYGSFDKGIQGDKRLRVQTKESGSSQLANAGRKCLCVRSRGRNGAASEQPLSSQGEKINSQPLGTQWAKHLRAAWRTTVATGGARRQQLRN